MGSQHYFKRIENGRGEMSMYLLKRLIKVVGSIRYYFIQGHAVYFCYPLSILNFTLIFYNFLIKDLSFIPPQYNNFFIFAVVFISIFVPVCATAGYYDCKKGLWYEEQKKAFTVHPVWSELFKQLKNIQQDIDKLKRTHLKQ